MGVPIPLKNMKIIVNLYIYNECECKKFNRTEYPQALQLLSTLHSPPNRPYHSKQIKNKKHVKIIWPE